MAIDRVRRVWLICPADQAQDLPHQLAQIGLVHVTEALPGDEAHADAVSHLAADTRAAEARIRKLAEALDTLAEFNKTTRDFLSNLIPTPVETTRSELAAALDAVDADRVHQQAKELSARRARAEAAAEQARQRLTALAPFRRVEVAVPGAGTLRWVAAGLWLAPEKQARRVLDRDLGPEAAILEQLAAAEGKALIASVCLPDDAHDAAERLGNLGFEPVAPPPETTTLAAYVEAVEAELRQATDAAQAAVAELTELARLRHQVELVLGHWEEQLATARALDREAATRRAAVLCGYVRERDAARFQADVAQRLPDVAVVTEEVGRGEDAPVSLSNHPVFRPAQFLVEMFGLPAYQQFDPSAFLMLSFILFFGICLGDAIYGIVLFALAWYLVRRYRNYPGIRSLFELLAWGAVTTFLVGVATGTWAADLCVKYLGESEPGKLNAFGGLVAGLKVADPLQKPLLALGIALFLGVANQFWGVTMKIYGCLRQGDRWGALFDGGFWLILLPGLVLLIAKFFSPELPGAVTTVGMGLALVGGVGLMLTQGRNEESLVGKIVVGIVSLYGIVGSYGAVAFIGDTLSYSRLLALGLTTAIVGMAINIIAQMIHEAIGVALVGVLAFAVVAVTGHFFNLLISGLGAFIHSARLIFVEFFGRFYDPGAVRFAPLGATGGRIRVMD